jgi:cell division protein FtsB
VIGLKGEVKRKGKSKENIIFAFCLVAIVVAFAIPMYYGAEKKFELENEISELAEQSAEAARYNNELKDRIKYSDEDEYVEKIAREKLNMVMPDEIIYVDKNK